MKRAESGNRSEWTRVGVVSKRPPSGRPMLRPTQCSSVAANAQVLFSFGAVPENEGSKDAPTRETPCFVETS
jgi:hypothetical protein